MTKIIREEIKVGDKVKVKNKGDWYNNRKTGIIVYISRRYYYIAGIFAGFSKKHLIKL